MKNPYVRIIGFLKWNWSNVQDMMDVASWHLESDCGYFLIWLFFVNIDSVYYKGCNKFCVFCKWNYILYFIIFNISPQNHILKLSTMKLLYIHLQTLKEERIANKAEIIYSALIQRDQPSLSCSKRHLMTLREEAFQCAPDKITEKAISLCHRASSDDLSDKSFCSSHFKTEFQSQKLEKTSYLVDFF